MGRNAVKPDMYYQAHEDDGSRGFMVLLVGMFIGAVGAFSLAYSWGWFA